MICTLHADFQPLEELPAFFAEIAEAIEGEAGPVYRILDTSTYDITFGELMIALAEETKSSQPGTLSDPRIRSVVVTRPGTIAELGAASTQQAQYGERTSHIVCSMDEALAYVHEKLTRG